MKYIAVLFCTLSFLTFGQEFNCQVTIITEAKVEVSTADQAMLDQMKTSIYEFMNNQQWTKR